MRTKRQRILDVLPLYRVAEVSHFSLAELVDELIEQCLVDRAHEQIAAVEALGAALPPGDA